MKQVLATLTVVMLIGCVAQAQADQTTVGQPSDPPPAAQTTTQTTDTSNVAAAPGPVSTPPSDASGSPSDSTTPPTDAPIPPADASIPPADASIPPADASIPSANPAGSGDSSGQTSQSTPGATTAPTSTSGTSAGTLPAVQPSNPPAPVQAATGPADPAPTTGAAAATTASQAIWQVQVSGCVAHCQGISQLQTAAQQISTTQLVQGAPPLPVIGPPQAGPVGAPNGLGGGTGAGGGSQAASRVTQIQLGCVQECFGTTTINAGSPQLSPAAVQELLGNLSLPALPLLSPAQATEQNSGSQTVYQSQTGEPRTILQVQSATQGDTTLQTIDPTLLADLAAGSGSPVVTQSAQGIWQLQVGCIFYCAGTSQDQQAVQSSTAIQVLPAATGASVSPTDPVINSATALIWQLQIGCLFFCYDAVQVQSASSYQNALLVIESPGTPGAPPAGAGGGSPDASGGASSPGDPPAGSAPIGVPTPTPAPGAGAVTTGPAQIGCSCATIAAVPAVIGRVSAPSALGATLALLVAAEPLPAGVVPKLHSETHRVQPAPIGAPAPTSLVPIGVAGTSNAAVAPRAHIRPYARRVPLELPLLLKAPSWTESQLAPNWAAASLPVSRAGGGVGGAVWPGVPATLLALAAIAFVLLRAGGSISPQPPTKGR